MDDLCKSVENPVESVEKAPFDPLKKANSTEFFRKLPFWTVDKWKNPLEFFAVQQKKIRSEETFPKIIDSQIAQRPVKEEGSPDG